MRPRRRRRARHRPAPESLRWRGTPCTWAKVPPRGCRRIAPSRNESHRDPPRSLRVFPDPRPHATRPKQRRCAPPPRLRPPRQSRPRTLDRKGPPRSPARARIGPLHILHFRQHVAQVFTVRALLAEPLVRAIERTLESRFGKQWVDTRAPSLLHIDQPRRYAPVGHRAINLVLGK